MRAAERFAENLVVVTGEGGKEMRRAKDTCAIEFAFGVALGVTVNVFESSRLRKKKDIRCDADGFVSFIH